MPDRRAGHRHGPRNRPPWWPRDEPFPPIDRREWRSAGRQFLRRVAVFMAVFFGLMFIANALVFAFFSDVFDEGEHRGRFFPFGAILVPALVVAFFLVGRSVRRLARPVSDVMEAADRLASGDHGVRVQERGPREMRQLARSFNQMAERLEANEEQRRNLLADIAHELRTPLTVIRGNAEGMIDGLYPADRAHLEPLLERTTVMARLLDDLQTLSTAEAGALELHREPIEPVHLIEQAVASFRPSAARKGVTLAERVEPGLPPIEVDGVRIGQVLANLLQNAVRHTPTGGSVTVAVEAADEGRSVAFTVEDTGPGIGDQDLRRIFDRFVKASDSGGAGLGLAIARSLVEAHGGRIEAHSRSGEGTTMRFVLPVVPG